MVCLIKPQFEAGREKVGKKGVVRDRSVHREVILSVLDCCDEVSFEVKELSFSPIKGPEGNIEYLILLGKGKGPFREEESFLFEREELIDRVIEEAFDTLAGT